MKYIFVFIIAIHSFCVFTPAKAIVQLIPMDSLFTGYWENNDYIAKAFPREVDSRDFAIPLDSQQILVIYPGSAESQVPHWQGLFNRQLGLTVPFARADTVPASQLDSRHLILLGSITNNRWILELYRQRHAYADANFPGPGGYVIHPATSVWNRDRNVIVVGAGSDGDLAPAFSALVGRLPKDSGIIGPVRSLHTDLSLPDPPPGIGAILREGLEAPYAKMPPYGTIADWGFYYHLTGDEAWAAHFRSAFHMLHDRARVTGKWIPEPWTNVYFNLWKLMLVWDKIDDDPFFTEQDRTVIEEVLWGYTTFVNWLPNLDAEQAVKGEMRQNHTTFLALSLYFSYRYYTEKYDMEGLEPMIEKVHRAFEDGQMASFIPNDDAGGYLKYVPLHTLTYLLAEGNLDYIQDGSLARIADLIGVTFDNFGNQVSFGDVGGYSHVARRTTDANLLAMAANYYQQPEYQWMYHWLNKNPAFSLEALYTGEYAIPMDTSRADRFLNVKPIYLDQPTLSWVGRRTERPRDLLRRGDRYFHKISFRGGFDPDDEYLLLDGISALSHGHHDGNSILRLTWKDRIWLFDLDYIKLNTKFHNGVTITRNGRQFDPPMVTRLDFVAEEPALGITKSTARNYNGADWERSIIWNKNRWFLVLDRIKAVEQGDYQLTGRWRTRGDVALNGNVLSVGQGGKSFFIKGADEASRSLEFEPDRYRSDWGNYPYGNDGLEVLVADKKLFLHAGEDFVFANLLTASDYSHDPGYTLLRINKGLYQVTDSVGSTVVGSAGAYLEDAEIFTDAALFKLDSGSLDLFDFSTFRFRDAIVSGDSASNHLKIDLQTGAVLDLSGNPYLKLAGAALQQLNRQLQAFLGRHGPAAGVLPQPPRAPVHDFGITRVAHQDTDTVSAHSGIEEGHYILGHANGRLSYFENRALVRAIRTPHGAAITAVALADMDGDGRFDIIAGDILGNLYCYDINGVMKWTHLLTPNYGPIGYARDIVIDKIGGSAHPTVLVGTSGWKVYAIDHGGSVRWEAFTFYHALTKLGILHQDNSPRYIVAGTEYQTPFNVIDPETGRVVYYAWEEMGSEFIAKTDYFGYHLTDMVFFDANGDGVDDLVFGTYSNTVYAVEAANGRKIWEANVGDEVSRMAAFDDPVTGDKRLLVGNDRGGLVLLDSRGKRLSGINLEHRITDLIALPEEGGRVEIAAVTKGGDMAVVDYSLKLQGFLATGNPLDRVYWTGKPDRAHQLIAIGEQTAELLEYEPLYLRKSRQY